MSAKIFLNSSTKYVPQMDMSIQYTENGGIEATQTFLARKADVGVGSNLNPFRRGTTWETVFPEVPILYRFLTMKTFDPQDHQPGIVAIKATFTGTQFNGNGSSGEEDSIPTSSLSGAMEEFPLYENRKWKALEDDEKWALGLLLSGQLIAKPGTMDGIGQFETSEVYGVDLTNYKEAEYNTGTPITYSDDAKKFIKMIAQGKTTYKRPSWVYNYRTESKTGFTAAQLASLGKIIANPLGNPIDPGTGWTWQLIGPSQEQSGQDRFFKDLVYQLIEDNEENQFLYGT